MKNVTDWRFLILTIAAAIFISSGLAQAGTVRDAAEGIIVIHAAKPGQQVADCMDAECSNGPVGKAIVDALANRDITIAGLFDRLNASVVRATKGQQRPWITASEPIDVPLAANTNQAFALVIGNGAYKYFPVLKGAPRDAKAVAASFKHLGFRTTTLLDAEGEVVVKAIDDFLARLGPDDTAVLYYSGHGFAMNGADYLPPLAAIRGTSLR